MDDKGKPEKKGARQRFKEFHALQYWIAAISYLVIFSLSILCLVAYIPDLSVADILSSGTLNFLIALLIVVLLSATGFFVWEMLQWRRGRVKKDQQPSLDDIVKEFRKDSDNNNP